MRTEEVEFQLSCDHKGAKKFVPRLNDLGLNFPDITREGDTLKIDYKLLIEYWGNVAGVLETFIEMIDSGIILTGDLVRMDEGTILIKRILESLQQIRHQKSKKRSIWPSWLKRKRKLYENQKSLREPNESNIRTPRAT